MSETPVDYIDILNYVVKADWDKKWNELRPNAVTKKFSWSSLDIGAVYRVTLCQEIIFDNFAVCNGRCKIQGTIPANTIVSIGKTQNLSKRMQDHFTPSKANSNRLLTRFNNIFPFPEAKGRTWLSEMILANVIKIEYVQIEDEEWWKRDLLESYGKAICRCLFDLEIEH